MRTSVNEEGQLTTNFKSLTPAYGRDYKSKQAVIDDFEANKDFILQPEGVYINKEQIAKGVTVNIRYKKQAHVCTIIVK